MSPLAQVQVQVPESAVALELALELRAPAAFAGPLDLGSDFFDSASWLVLLKSRALLPHAAEGREAPPEQELRQALLAHEGSVASFGVWVRMG